MVTSVPTSLFCTNYLFELPEELQTLIYRKLLKYTLSVICDMREPIDNYNKLIAYVTKNNKYCSDPNKNRAIWNLFLCERRDIGDPYYKYFQYYASEADEEGNTATNVLRLNKTKMIRYDNRYSTIRYIDYSIYPLNIRVSDESFMCMKKIIDEYAVIFLCYDADADNEYANIRTLSLLNDKIRVEYKDNDNEYVFRNTIDIYNNLLEAYNLITKIFDILFMYNHLYPAYDLEYMNDIIDLRDWFEYNKYFHGFSIADTGDIVRPRFYS
jgi:hypothetical protein